MLLADYCIEFKDGHFSTSNRKGNFPLSFEFLFCLFFYSLYELNLGDNNEAVGNMPAASLLEYLATLDLTPLSTSSLCCRA